jgi:hypothetical protein
MHDDGWVLMPRQLAALVVASAVVAGAVPRSMGDEIRPALQATEPSVRPGQATTDPRASSHRDDALTRLFTPMVAPPGIYQVSVTDAPIEQVAAAFARLPGADPRAWHVASAGLTEAFGTEGPYDRARLARLINGGRIRMARGSVSVSGETVAYSLVTPVPDPSFSTLGGGTMILTVHAERLMKRD